MTQFQWTDSERTSVRRKVGENDQFIPVDSTIYREEVLPWIASGGFITDSLTPEAPPDYPGFRGAIALVPEYDRILDAIAAISITWHSSIVRAWGEVKDLESLKLAVKFWNLRVFPNAQIAPEEATVLQNLADQFNVPIVVKSDGFIEVVS
ncbi:hypothetical protein [Coleofasciculus sp. FACHB-T130]|uniref:hypothetical protein n=1 Tax=Cyanophyceae TaxID=3028117 RepID=UPI001683C753|nr:hypothetical protein [Coleofasciculus sp. FACHB-T130]MBD1878383.1 hypothetical protein [Coleofasciculus sp. FACHB-T130]